MQNIDANMNNMRAIMILICHMFVPRIAVLVRQFQKSRCQQHSDSYKYKHEENV